MARVFRAASSRYMAPASVPISGFPFAMGAIILATNDAAADQTVMAICDAGDAQGGHRLMFTGGTYASGFGFGARSSVTGLDKEAHYATAATVSTWYWVLAVFASATDRRIYVVAPGVIGTAQQTSSLTPTMSTFDIGRAMMGGVATTYLDGRMGYCTVWDSDFTTAEVDSYWTHAMRSNTGFVDPLLIKPGNLKFYWRGTRDGTATTSDGVDWIGGVVVADGNTPAYGDDPPVQRQWGN